MINTTAVSNTIQPFFSKKLLDHAVQVTTLADYAVQEELAPNSGGNQITFFRPPQADLTATGAPAALTEGTVPTARRDIAYTPVTATLAQRGQTAELTDVATTIGLFDFLKTAVAPADRPPYRSGGTPGMLAEIDLPALRPDPGPWVGTPAAELTKDRIDAGAIGCNTVHLFGKVNGTAIQDNRFRTFVFSGAKLPPQVGLTQTVGALPPRQAAAFVTRFREQMAECPELDATAGTEVTELGATGRGPQAMSVWHLSTALPGDRTIEYDVAVLRQGTAVSVLVYVAAPRAQIADTDFVALAQRALQRLARIAPYDQG